MGKTIMFYLSITVFAACFLAIFGIGVFDQFNYETQGITPKISWEYAGIIITMIASVIVAGACETE